MQAAVTSRHGGPETLVVCEVATPSPEAGQVRVRVLAAGVGSGHPPMAQVFPLGRIHEAQQVMRATDTLGKVVAAIGDDGLASREDASRT